MAHITINSAEDFQAQVLASTLPVIVDFWAEWCGPCRMVAPVFDELSETYKDKVIFAKLNTDNVPEIAAKHQVQSIPTMIIFKGGEEVSRTIGAYPKNHYIEEIDKVL